MITCALRNKRLNFNKRFEKLLQKPTFILTLRKLLKKMFRYNCHLLVLWKSHIWHRMDRKI